MLNLVTVYSGALEALVRIHSPKAFVLFLKITMCWESLADSASQTQTTATAGDAGQTFFSSKALLTVGGKASLQPKRTPVSNEEIEAILVCIHFLIDF